jgi:hypothetical protein
MRPDINRVGQVRVPKNDQVPFKTTLAAKDKSLAGGFLENT